MRKEDKIKWILEYIQKYGSVDVLDSRFHKEYINNCKPKTTDWHGLDFAIAPELGRYLSEMYKNNLIRRTKISLGYRERHAPSYIYKYFI